MLEWKIALREGLTKKRQGKKLSSSVLSQIASQVIGKYIQILNHFGEVWENDGVWIESGHIQSNEMSDRTSQQLPK